MAGISLTGVQNNVKDIVPLWRFEFELPTITGSLVTPPPQAFGQKFSLNNQNINSEDEEIANWPKHFPTGSNVDTASITMLEDGGVNAWRVFQYWDGWMKVIHDRNGDYGLPVDYWKTITVYSLGTTGRRLAKFELLEAWPTNVAGFDFDGESSAAVFNVINLTVSDVKMTKL